MKHRVQTVYAARLAGTPVFDPIGEKVGSVYDVVVLFRLRGDPLAVGLSIGTASHALGTVRALEVGEVEGAMSGLAIVVTGLLTVLVAPLFMSLIC